MAEAATKQRVQPQPRRIAYSSSHEAELHDYAQPDIDEDDAFWEMFLAAREYTMTAKDAMFALYQAVGYVVRARLEGDFVEAGVWRGGSALLAALAFRKLGDRRRLHLFDTFTGMTAPTDVDTDIMGDAASDLMDRFAEADGSWCYASEEDVRSTFSRHGISGDDLNIVKGDVLNTLPLNVPDRIAILRLDTDWYESTRLELELLYPRLVRGGVLMIDDYGYWQGSRKATDEYFAALERPPLLNRVNDQVRLAIKV